MLCWLLTELSRSGQPMSQSWDRECWLLPSRIHSSRHGTPFQLEGFAFSTSSCHILQHRTLEAGFMGNHVIHVAHDMPGNYTLWIFPQGPFISWNWTTQSPVKMSCCFPRPTFVLRVELIASLLSRLILRLIVFGCYLLFLDKIMRSLL